MFPVIKIDTGTAGLIGPFDGEVKPFRVGAYLRKYASGLFYSWWDGEKWGMGWRDIQLAAPNTLFPLPPSDQQSLPWYGLDKEVK